MGFFAGLITGIVGTLAALVVALLWPDRAAYRVDFED